VGGAPLAITAASWSSGTATITANNNFMMGDSVVIAGVTGSLVPGGYDGKFTIASIITDSGIQTGFTYALTTDPGTATLNSSTARAANGALTISVQTGSGSDKVNVFADPPNHTFIINTGGGDDVVFIDGDPNQNAHNIFIVNLGDGNDIAQINGADLASSDTLNVDGGDGFNTLLSNLLAHATTSNFQVTGDLAVPTISTGGPYTINEGDPLQLNGLVTAVSGISDTQAQSIVWILYGDNETGEVVDPSVVLPTTPAASNPMLSWAQLESLHITHGGTYNIQMEVTTVGGSFNAFTTLVVNTVPPTITLTADANAEVSKPYTVSFGAVFPGDETATGWTVNWGDGTTPTSLPSDAMMATHTYTKVGNYNVVASVTDVNGTYDSAPQSVDVSVNVNSLSAGGPYTINAGASLTLTATAEGTPTTAQWDLFGLGTYADVIPAPTFKDNGDGTSTSTVTLSWSQLEAIAMTDLGHPIDAGMFNSVSVQATYSADQVAAGFLTSPSTTLTVKDVAPTAMLSGTAQEGGTGSVTFTNQFSYIQTSGFTYSYDVGNTGTFQDMGDPSSTFTIPPSDLYKSGPLVVRGRITDMHGLFTDYTITVTVVNQKPMFGTFAPPTTAIENAVYSFSNVPFSDPGEDTITASIDWGDGSSPSQGKVTTTNTGLAPTTGTVAGSHTYAYRPTAYTVTITLRDDDGATAMQSFRVTVADPPLSVTVPTSGQTAREGDTFILTGATFNDPGAPDSYTATVDWGDGSSNATVDPPASGADSGHVYDNHVYGHAGVYPVTVTVFVKAPDNAAEAAASNMFMVTVTNVAPTVNAGADIPAGPGVPVNVNATFSDPSFPIGGVGETYTATIDWGDKTTSPGIVHWTNGSSTMPTTGTVTAATPHQYSGDGPYTVTVTVSDGTDSGYDTLVVTDAPPTVTPSPDLSGNEGTLLNLNASFSDLGFNFGGAMKSFTATIDWGDNTSSTGIVTVVPGSIGMPTTGTISGSHVYATFGSFPITIHVVDEAGVEGLGSLNADVANVAPKVNPFSVGSFYSQGVFVLHDTFTDPGLGDSHEVTIDWGDKDKHGNENVSQLDEYSFYGAGGSLYQQVVEPTATSAGQITAAHQYTDGLPHTITVTVTDDGDLSGHASRVYLIGQHLFAVGTDAGSPPEVKVYDSTTGAAKLDFYAYPASATGGVRVAVSDVNGDGMPDIITVPGPGSAAEVRAFDGRTGQMILDFYAFPTTLTTGFYVAAGDVNRDGYADIVVGTDAGTASEVRVFSGTTGEMLYDFYPYGSFAGGVRVAVGDVDGDRFGDIITGPGAGTAARVSVYSGATGAMLRNFYAFPASFQSGIYVAAGDLNGDGLSDIIVGAGAGGAEVRVFDGGSGAMWRDFYAYDGSFAGGVRVGSTNPGGAHADNILTSPSSVPQRSVFPPINDGQPAVASVGASIGPLVHVLDGMTLALVDNFFAFDPSFTGGAFVGGA
jgi:hypothetical protein